MPLSMNNRPVGDVTIVQCNGRIVAGGEVFSLQAHLGDILPHHGDVVLQLEQVDFVDSSGLGALVRLVATARAGGGDIKLCGVQPRLRKTLEMTSLLTMFEIYDSEAEAIIAAYLGSRYSKQKSGGAQLRVLCVFDSLNVRTFLREVLCRAGYSALTTANVPDAKILMKATKAKLVILGAKQQSVHGIPAKKLFEEIDPSVSVVVLDENFEKLDPGECATELLDRVRAIAQSAKTEV
jgi:anti-sigma B factor antagonist